MSKGEAGGGVKSLNLPEVNGQGSIGVCRTRIRADDDRLGGRGDCEKGKGEGGGS